MAERSALQSTQALTEFKQIWHFRRMPHTPTREELYQRVWSMPLKHLAVEWSTTHEVLRAACERAGVPRPGHGYWTLREMGRSPQPTPLGAAPEGFLDPLSLVPKARRIVKRPPASQAIAVQVQPPIQAAIQTPAADAESVPAVSVPIETPIARPTTPTTLTREALYNEVWRTPMFRLAAAYGISGNGLAKICDRANLPYPSRGYWAKLAAGRTLDQPALPKAPGISGSSKITIRPTPTPAPPAQLPPEIAEIAQCVKASVGAIQVSQRLNNPHPVIAKWLTDHKDELRRSRLEEPRWRQALAPVSFTEQDRRKHRILDALFKALSRNKVVVREDERRVLAAEVLGEKIEFAIREKYKQGRRPLTDDEKRWRSAGEKDWRQELTGTGFFIFEIKRYLPAGFARQWLETDAEPMETLIPDIVATVVSVGPLLVKERETREEAERQHRMAEQRRYEERQGRKREDNRWRRFTDLANRRRKLAVARDFLDALKADVTDNEADIDGRTAGEWLTWAEGYLKRADPLAGGVAGVFRDIASITEWSYRE